MPLICRDQIAKQNLIIGYIQKRDKRLIYSNKIKHLLLSYSKWYGDPTLDLANFLEDTRGVNHV